MPDRDTPSRVDAAFSALREQILSGALPPSDILTEPELADRLGMSRTPVREAVIRLEAMGLVDVLPSRGIRAAPLDRADVREIFDLLLSLEPDAAARLAERAPDEQDLAPLFAAQDAMETSLAAKDIDAWTIADDTFHNALLTLHGNDRLTRFAGQLFDQLHRVRLLTLRVRALPQRATDEHREILTHLAAGDVGRTRRTFRRHWRRTTAETMEALDQLGLPTV